MTSEPIDFNQAVKQLQEAHWKEALTDISCRLNRPDDIQEAHWNEALIDLQNKMTSDMRVLTADFSRQINIAELLTKDAEAFLTKLAVRHVLEKNPLTPPRNQPHGPVRKGHGGKARRW